MRWPFHFGKAARAESTAASESAAPPQRRDWASLAPIQRAIGDAPLTAPSLEFSRSLAGSDEPPLHLETLGHLRTPKGPQGLVVGIASPIESYAPSTELVGRPRRRSEPIVSVQTAPQELIGVPAGGAGASDTLEDDSGADLLTRMLPALTGGAVSAPLAVSRLTDASRVELAGLRPVQRSAEMTSSAPPAEAGAASPTSQPPPPAPAGTRLNLGLSRRHGLGAPIRGTETASVQRSTAPSTPPAVPSPAEVQVSTAEKPHADEPNNAAGPRLSVQPAIDLESPQGTSVAEWLSPLPVVRRQGARWRTEESVESTVSETAGAASEAVGVTGEASPPPTLAPAPGPAHVSIQRLVGPEPARPAARESRLASDANRAATTAPLTSLRPPLTSVRIPVEPTLVAVPGGQTPRSIASFGGMPQPAVQRSPAVPWAPTSSAGGAPASPPFHGPLVWNIQRLAPAESPGAEPAAGTPAAGESPFSGAPAVASAPAGVPAASAVPSSGGRAESAPQPGEAAAPGAGGPAGGAPAAGATAPHGEKELHELAQALFHPLMSMVRREVLIERERAGFVTDLR